MFQDQQLVLLFDVAQNVFSDKEIEEYNDRLFGDQKDQTKWIPKQRVLTESLGVLLRLPVGVLWSIWSSDNKHVLNKTWLVYFYSICYLKVLFLGNYKYRRKTTNGIVAVHQYWKGFVESITPQWERNHWLTENIQASSSQTSRGRNVPATSPQGQRVQCSEKLQKTQDSTGLRWHVEF